MRRTRLYRRFPALAALCAAGGCANYQDQLAIRDSAAVLAEGKAEVDAERAAATEESARIGASGDGATPVPVDPPAEPVPEVVDLEIALRIAARRNRDLLRDREGLTLTALVLLDARNAVGPRLTGTLRHAIAGSDDGEDTVASGGDLTLSALLPTGGAASITADVSKDRGRGDILASSATGDVTARLSQPLLRGAGYESSHEALTDAERQVVYDLRSFELARQDLALDVQQAYYGIVAQKQVVRNREARLESLAFLKRRSERLFELGRVSEVDKFRAVREYLTAENDLVDARQELAVRLDRFKVQLHVDTAAKFDVADRIPDPRRVDLDLRRAVDLAVVNRLDLMTARDQIDDADRRERIRARDVLPDLRLELTGRRADAGARGVGDVTPLARDSYAAGLTLELPFDRQRERSALRASRIAADRARRDLTLAEDRVLLDVRDALRSLRSAESSLAIQDQITTSEEKNVKIARLRFEEGTIGNRDLTDALSNLADAQDRLVREKANVEIARLRVARAVGTLTLNEDGTWRE